MLSKKIGLSVAVGALAIASASMANAATVIPVGSPKFFITNGTPFTPSITAVFFDAFSTPTSFDDLFEFTIPQNGVGSGSISTSFSSALNKLALTSLKINGVSYPLTTTSSGEAAAVGGVPIISGHLNTIEVVGSGVGAFDGTATFTATVPEPASWAMMIGGLGLIGVALRRRSAGLSPA